MCVFVYYNMYVCGCSSVCRYDCVIREYMTSLKCYPRHDVAGITTTNLAISNVTPNMHELYFNDGIDCDAVEPPRPTSEPATTAASATTTSTSATTAASTTTTSEPATTAESTTTTSEPTTTALLKTTTSAGGLLSCIKQT